jgi:transcriptional regulator with XRE-family HTH domain
MNIQKYMEKHKLSYRQFAEKMEISHTTVFHFLSGRTRSLSLPIIQKIIEGTKGEISLKDILDEAGLKKS